jgi:hypothetical protein
MPVERAWDDGGDITLGIPEDVAQQIRDLAEQQDYLWPGFAPSLAAKLNDLCDQVA